MYRKKVIASLIVCIVSQPRVMLIWQQTTDITPYRIFHPPQITCILGSGWQGVPNGSATTPNREETDDDR